MVLTGLNDGWRWSVTEVNRPCHVNYWGSEVESVIEYITEVLTFPLMKQNVLYEGAIK